MAFKRDHLAHTIDNTEAKYINLTSHSLQMTLMVDNTNGKG